MEQTRPITLDRFVQQFCNRLFNIIILFVVVDIVDIVVVDVVDDEEPCCPSWWLSGWSIGWLILNNVDVDDNDDDVDNNGRIVVSIRNEFVRWIIIINNKIDPIEILL